MKEPKKKDYGWHTQSGFDDEPSGWYIDGGEEAYDEAIKAWHNAQKKQLVPFSNGTEYTMWQDANCHQCTKYENESTCEADARCKLAFYLDMGALGEDVPTEILMQVGWNAEANRISPVCRGKQPKLSIIYQNL